MNQELHRRLPTYVSLGISFMTLVNILAVSFLLLSGLF